MARQTRENAVIMRRTTIKVGLLAALALSWAALATAQSLPKPFDEAVKAPATEEPAANGATEVPLEDRVAAAKEKLLQAEERYNAVKDISPEVVAEQYGVTPEAVVARIRARRFAVRLWEQHLDAFSELREIRQSRQDLDAEVDAWIGFPESTEITFDLAEELRDAIVAKRLEIDAVGVEQSTLRHLMGDSQARLDAARQHARFAAEALGDGDEDAASAGKRWDRDVAVQAEQNAVNMLALQKVREQVLTETKAFHEAGLDFLDRKLELAKAISPFTQDVLDRKLETLKSAREGIEKEQEQAYEASQRTEDALTKAREDLRAAREAKVPEGEDAAENAAAIARLQAAADARKVEFDTARLAVETFERLVDILRNRESVWEDRFKVAQMADDASGLSAVLKDMTGDIEFYRSRARMVKPYYESNLQATLAQISNLEQRLAAWQPQDGDKAPVQKQLDSYREREQLYRRGQSGIAEFDRLLTRWQEELNDRRLRVPVQERFVNTLSEAYGVVAAVWHYELFSVEEKSVTVGKVFLAVLILSFGLVLARRLSRRLGKLMTQRFHAQESVASPVEKAFYYVLIVLVVLFALTTVEIPLGIFVYFGGALAIGVGFGAQNLINNFISGLIMLIERPIKINDIVDVEGVRGRVVNIGSRCSQVRRFDGIDMLVPNSAFLEKNVTNWTLSDRMLRFSVSVGVAYGSPTREVHRLIERAVTEHGKVLEYPEPVVLFEDFGDSALIFTVYFWLEVNTFMDYRIVASDVRFRIDKLMREAGITIAFPQRDIHVDSLSPIQVEVVSRDAPDRASNETKQPPDTPNARS